MTTISTTHNNCSAMPAKSDFAVMAGGQTTEDRLLDGQIRLIQPADGYRVAIDPVLLAAAVPARPGDQVMDLGAGVGGATLCLLARQPACRVTGLEINPDYVRLARENMANNGFSQQAGILERSIASIDDQLLETADHVMANPPYLPIGRAAPTHRDDAATVESEATLADWVRAAAAVVRPKGSITFIQRADRLDALLAEIRGLAGDITVCPLWPKVGKPAKRVLVRARKGVSTPLKIVPGLVLHTEDGRYTARAEQILRGASAFDLSAP